MDNQDIGDIYDEVLKRYAGLHAGKVMAEGIVKCEGWNATWRVGRLS